MNGIKQDARHEKDGTEMPAVIRTSDIICGAQCKMKMHGPLFKNDEIQDSTHESMKPSTGPFYTQSPLCLRRWDVWVPGFEGDCLWGLESCSEHFPYFEPSL